MRKPLFDADPQNDGPKGGEPAKKEPVTPVAGDDGKKYQIADDKGNTREVTLTELVQMAKDADTYKAKATKAESAATELETIKADLTEALLKNDPAAADRLMEKAGFSAEYRAQTLAAMKGGGQPEADWDEDLDDDDDFEDEDPPKKPKGKKEPKAAPKTEDPEARKLAKEALEAVTKKRQEDNVRLLQTSLEKALDGNEELSKILKKDDGKNPWPALVRKSATDRLLALIRARGFDPSTLDGFAKQAVKDTQNQMASFKESLGEGKQPPNAGPAGIVPTSEFDFTKPFTGEVPNVVTQPDEAKSYIGQLLAKELAGVRGDNAF